LLVGQVEGEKQVDLAQSLVQLIVRNLYERTADVRWWATDSALWQALAGGDEGALRFASERLGVIHRYYTVYVDLVMTDLNGRVVANANPRYRHALKTADLSNAEWYRAARALSSGDEYVVGDVERSVHHDNRQVLVYATGVRARGQAEGELLGTLGVYFNWEDEGATIVETESCLPDAVRDTTDVLLLDGKRNVIASTDPALMFKPFALEDNGEMRGCYEGRDQRVAFAKTQGYQEYDGLGWYGVVVSRG
jgi:hypothetical protein